MYKWEADGEPKGVIVIIHGAMEHHGRYRWLAEMWRSSGYHVITGDLPGQGVTTRSQRGHIDSFDEYIYAVKEWVQEAYQYGAPVFLLGHSMGGLSAIRTLQTSRLPVGGVILSSPCLGLADYPSRAMNMLSAGLNKIVPSLKVPTKMKVEYATRNRQVIEMALNDSLFVTKVTVRWYRELVRAMKEAFTNMSEFPDVPLLVLQGGDDRIVNKSDVRRWFNEVSLSEKHYKEWSGCYHELFNEPEREYIFEFSYRFVESTIHCMGAHTK